MTNKTALHKWERLYALLLRLYPHKFRREYGDEMHFVFAASLRNAAEREGNKGVLVHLGRTLVDLVASLWHEHLQDRKAGRAMEQQHALYTGFAPAGGTGMLQQPSARKMEYEFRTGDQLVGTLHWPRLFRSTCIADTAAGTWTFRRHGIFNLHMTAHGADSEQAVLVFKPNWTGMNGPITHVDGREFHLRGTNMWGTSFALVQKQAQGEELALLAIKIHFRLLRGSAEVAIQPALAQMDDAALLAMFGCYLALVAYDDSANMSSTYGGVAAITD